MRVELQIRMEEVAGSILRFFHTSLNISVFRAFRYTDLYKHRPQTLIRTERTHLAISAVSSVYYLRSSKSGPGASSTNCADRNGQSALRRAVQFFSAKWFREFPAFLQIFHSLKTEKSNFEALIFNASTSVPAFT